MQQAGRHTSRVEQEESGDVQYDHVWSVCGGVGNLWDLCTHFLLRFNISDIVFRYIHWRESNFIQSTGATDRTAQHLAERTEVHQLWTVGHWDPYRREKHTEFTNNVSHPWRNCFCENHAKLQKVVVTFNPFPAKPWKWRQEECWAAAKMRRQFGILQGVESGRKPTESLEVFDYQRCLDLDVLLYVTIKILTGGFQKKTTPQNPTTRGRKQVLIWDPVAS